MKIRILLSIVLLVAACDRKIEPFDPAEKPKAPELSKIFPPEPRQTAAVSAPAAAPAAAAPMLASDAEPLRGEIRVSEELQDRIPKSAVLFLVARLSEQGPPLAVERIENPRFPMKFELGPDDRMVQTMPFVGPLQLSVRIDSDGNVSSREPGDLLGKAPGSFQPGDSDIVVVVDQTME